VPKRQASGGQSLCHDGRHRLAVDVIPVLRIGGAIGFKYLLALVCIVNSCEFEDV